MSSFLDSLTFLSTEQRELLRAEDLDTPEAFHHITLARLEAPPFNLSTGRAGKVLAAAKPVNGVHTVAFAEPPDRATKIERALHAAHADPAKVAVLPDFGVEQVVLDTDGKVDPAKTQAMRAHAATGAPVGATWQGNRIASTRALSAPSIWRSPRTRRPLQNGRDEVTGTPWAELGLDGLRVAAFGYEEDMFSGLSEEQVLAGMKSDLRTKVAARMEATDVKPESMDAVVVYQPPAVRPAWAREPSPPLTSQPVGARPVSLQEGLMNLLLACFSADEMRQFAHHNTDVGPSLPGANVSTKEMAFKFAEALIRHGYVNSQLRDALVLARPRRLDEINAVFRSAGIG